MGALNKERAMPDDTPRVPPAKAAPNQKMIERIIGKKDALEQLESPFIRKKFVLRTPLVKRLYLRLFDPCQLCFHVITVTGRSNLASEKVGQIEATIATGLEKLMEYLQEEKRGAEALLQMNALELDEIEVMAPLPVEARIISPLSFSLQQAISTADELVMAIELLVISGIVKINRGEQQKAEVRNRLRRTASGARLLANGVRKLIQQEQQRRTAEEANREAEDDAGDTGENGEDQAAAAVGTGIEGSTDAAAKPKRPRKAPVPAEPVQVAT